MFKLSRNGQTIYRNIIKIENVGRPKIMGNTHIRHFNTTQIMKSSLLLPISIGVVVAGLGCGYGLHYVTKKGDYKTILLLTGKLGFVSKYLLKPFISNIKRDTENIDWSDVEQQLMYTTKSNTWEDLKKKLCSDFGVSHMDESKADRLRDLSHNISEGLFLNILEKEYGVYYISKQIIQPIKEIIPYMLDEDNVLNIRNLIMIMQKFIYIKKYDDFSTKAKSVLLKTGIKMSDVRIILSDIAGSEKKFPAQAIEDLNGLASSLSLSKVTSIGSHIIYINRSCFPKFNRFEELDKIVGLKTVNPKWNHSNKSPVSIVLDDANERPKFTNNIKTIPQLIIDLFKWRW